MIIDSHVHFWKFDKKRDSWITGDMKILRQNYLPEHLLPTLRRNGVDACVAVQASQTELETHFLTELAHSHTEIKGVVGWINLQQENIGERLEYFSQYPVIKGWRHILQSEPGDIFENENFLRGIAALSPYRYTYDILIYHHQLKQALAFVTRFPDQPFVIDHCAKPDIAGKNINDWKVLIREMAAFPNLYCKISGLFTEARWKEWSPGEFYPYLDAVFEAFGTNRLLFGSDWPVLLLSGIYVQWKSLLEKYMENFSEEERLAVFGGNATAFYNL